MPIALVTNYLADYRLPLYERLADSHPLEVLCYGGRASYIPPWFGDLDRQLGAAPFPARRLRGAPEALGLGRNYETIIAPFAGGPILPSAYLGARARRRRFILWASVWAQPRSPAHLLSSPLIRRIYRQADAVIAYGEHVRRFVASIRGRDNDVFVAPQAVEAELFGRVVSDEEVESFRSRHQLPDGPLVLYVGRLVQEKGVGVLAEAWARRGNLVTIGDGPLRAEVAGHHLGPLPRAELPVAYAAAAVVTVPSIPTPRFLEPWGLVCNEAMHQGRAVVATHAVGAAAGGLVRDEETGLVVPPNEPRALEGAIERLLSDFELRARLGAAARDAVSAYTYEAMVEAFESGLRAAAAA